MSFTFSCKDKCWQYVSQFFDDNLKSRVIVQWPTRSKYCSAYAASYSYPNILQPSFMSLPPPFFVQYLANISSYFCFRISKRFDCVIQDSFVISGFFRDFWDLVKVALAKNRIRQIFI